MICFRQTEGQLNIDNSTSTLGALEFSFSRIWSRFLWHGGWRISYFLFNISFGSEQRQRHVGGFFYWFSYHQLWRSSLDSMVGRFGWWGGLFTPARQDIFCPKFGLTTPFLRKNQIKMVPNLRQTLAGAAGGDLRGGDGVHLCHLCLRHRQDERPEVWTDSPVCNLD